MINLVVDAANDKIFFAIMTESKSYTTTHLNSRENFDKFMKLLIEFLKKNNTNLRNIDNILINQGPGKFSSIRISISIVKGISLANNINLIGFNSNDIKLDKSPHSLPMKQGILKLLGYILNII